MADPAGDARAVDVPVVDVSVLMLGIDADARPEVQAKLLEIARHGDSAGPEGLVQMLREALTVLRHVSGSWTHAAAENHAPMPPDEAERRFREATARVRGRFEHELIRTADGKTERRPAPELPERSDVPGVVVVTLVVAKRGELADVADARDRRNVARAMDTLASIDPDDFVAMEVVWSPADERDRASAEEIERRYPELTRLAPEAA